MSLVLRVGLVSPLTLCHLEVSLSFCVAVHGQLGAGTGQGGGEGAVCGQLLCWGDGELGGEGLSEQHAGEAATGLHLHS